MKYFLHRPLIEATDLCTLHELQDGTYSIDDVAMFHDLLDLRKRMKPQESQD